MNGHARVLSSTAANAAVTLLTLLACSTSGLADQPTTYSQRMEFDPTTGQWVQLAPPVPGTEAGDLALARSYLAMGEYRDARRAFEDWFERYPTSELYPEALFYAAETEILAEDADPKSGDIIKAYEWLEQLLEDWPTSPLADRAIRKEMNIAEMLLFKDRKRKIWRGMFWVSGEEEALQMLDRIIDQWAPDTPAAELALRRKADYHFISGEFEESELAYKRLMREFPRGRYHRIAMLRSGQSALARFPGVEFDEADLLEAEVYFRDFLNAYPRDAEEHSIPQQLSGINERLAEKEFTIAQFYERTRSLDAAVFYYRYLVASFPGTVWAAQAQDRLFALGADAGETEQRPIDDVIETDVPPTPAPEFTPPPRE